ncbi:hypothetical protein DM02DRAFT_627079 [Periconia macrospinosa]|uniref:Uncharacterized protein n=1 Tax=Periconia macrospinosa TaxID=97972 RepID=A0A2V1DYQ8_9PLEO|nr:hypothetical protein DM02DRAFT_627079 [Periconia macrospinosa]
MRIPPSEVHERMSVLRRLHHSQRSSRVDLTKTRQGKTRHGTAQTAKRTERSCAAPSLRHLPQQCDLQTTKRLGSIRQGTPERTPALRHGTDGKKRGRIQMLVYINCIRLVSEGLCWHCA